MCSSAALQCFLNWTHETPVYKFRKINAYSITIARRIKKLCTAYFQTNTLSQTVLNMYSILDSARSDKDKYFSGFYSSVNMKCNVISLCQVCLLSYIKHLHLEISQLSSTLNSLYMCLFSFNT